MDNKIGKYIKDQREERNLTQTELADKLYVSRQTISKWENGINKPDRVTFKKVENVLGSSFEDYKKKKRKEISDISKKKKKSLALGLFFMSCLVILTVYFAYYFINTYDKTQIYIVTGESERSVVTSGL